MQTCVCVSVCVCVCIFKPTMWPEAGRGLHYICMYGFCVQSIRRGNWYRYANHCSVRCYINLAKSRQENRSRIARYWLPRSKECADLHDVSSSFVRELKRNNKQTNKQYCTTIIIIEQNYPAEGGGTLRYTLGEL